MLIIRGKTYIAYTISVDYQRNGVPQGPVIGPLLLRLFVNDLPYVLETLTLLFADDVKIVSRRSQSMNLRSSLTAAWDWSKNWARSSHGVVFFPRWVWHPHPCTHICRGPAQCTEAANKARQLIFMIRRSPSSYSKVRATAEGEGRHFRRGLSNAGINSRPPSLQLFCQCFQETVGRSLDRSLSPSPPLTEHSPPPFQPAHHPLTIIIYVVSLCLLFTIINHNHYQTRGANVLHVKREISCFVFLNRKDV